MQSLLAFPHKKFVCPCWSVALLVGPTVTIRPIFVIFIFFFYTTFQPNSYQSVLLIPSFLPVNLSSPLLPVPLRQKNEGDLFHRLWHVMNEILDLRRQVLVGHLTHDRLRDVKQHITARLDWGNEWVEGWGPPFQTCNCNDGPRAVLYVWSLPSPRKLPVVFSLHFSMFQRVRRWIFMSNFKRQLCTHLRAVIHHRQHVVSFTLL